MKNIEEYLEKAGFEGSLKKILTHIAIIALLPTLVSYFLQYNLVLTYFSFKLVLYSLLFIVGVYPVAVIAISLLAVVVIDFQITRRKQKIESLFPDFLHSVAANIRAGMPTDRAIWQSVTPQFGVLGKEIEIVAKKSMTGVELGEALIDFSKRYESKLLRRSVSLINEGINAGSKLEDLLKKLAINLEDLQLRRNEMAANLTSYVFFISFAVLIAAPLMFGFATQFLMIIRSIGEKVSFEAVQGTAISINFSADAVAQSDFVLFCVLNLLLSSVMASIIVAQIQTGKMIYALPRIPVFFVVTLLLFFASSKLLETIFSAII